MTFGDAQEVCLCFFQTQRDKQHAPPQCAGRIHCHERFCLVIVEYWQTVRVMASNDGAHEDAQSLPARLRTRRAPLGRRSSSEARRSERVQNASVQVRQALPNLGFTLYQPYLVTQSRKSRSFVLYAGTKVLAGHRQTTPPDILPCPHAHRT